MRKLTIATFMLTLIVLPLTYAQEKITGPWLWMIAPTEIGQPGAASIHVDSLAVTSGGAVTETHIAANGANVGDPLGNNYTWTLAEIRNFGADNPFGFFGEIDNVTDVVNRIGWAEGNVEWHSSYALITLESPRVQNNVVMKVGSDDAIKVWLNGKLVHNNPVNRGAGNFQDEFRINLKQGDNLLLVKVSQGWGNWTMFVGVEADVNPIYKSRPGPTSDAPVRARSVPDVNGDGIVNIQDLVLVGQRFGQRGQNDADVNRDGIVDIADLVLVAWALGQTAAPSLVDPASLKDLTVAEVRHWMSMAAQIPRADVRYQEGILILERLLAVLTPQENALLPNYPNPFNPETWIPYHLAEPADVTLTIHSIEGEVVKHLEVGHQASGFYQSKARAAYWDGRNALGERISSGIYFYTLTAGDFSATKKMLIRK